MTRKRTRKASFSYIMSKPIRRKPIRRKPIRRKPIRRKPIGAPGRHGTLVH